VIERKENLQVRRRSRVLQILWFWWNL